MINVVSSVKEVIKSDLASHQKCRKAFLNQVEANTDTTVQTVTKGLKQIAWYKERLQYGKILYESQRIVPLGDLKTTVQGGKHTYNVVLKAFKCDCNAFGCKHILFATAHFYDIDVEYLFPEEYTFDYYRRRMDAFGEYPDFPSTAEMSKDSDSFDPNLRIPIGGKRSRGAPKEAERKRPLKEQAMKENKKRSAIMK
jgi:hypothetical protein